MGYKLKKRSLDRKSVDVLNKEYRFCSNHSESSMYYFTNNGGKRLLYNAIPTFFNVPNPPPSVGEKRKPPTKRNHLPLKVKKIQNENNDSKVENTQANIETVNIKKYRKVLNSLRTSRVTICRLRKKIKLLEKKKHKSCNNSINHILELSKNFLSDDQQKFFTSQIKMSYRHKKGYWTISDKLLGLRVIFHSPQTYKMLSNIFSLPSRNTLKLFLTRAYGDMPTGFSQKLFTLLKLRVNNMNQQDRNCSLVLDEMALKQHLDYDKSVDVVFGIKNKKPLNQALVFIIRGIATKWKQPIAYFFSNSTVSTVNLIKFIQEAISKVQDCGLLVRCIVCDQGSTNIAALKILGFSKIKSYIQHLSLKNRIHIIFDPPHLIKSVRNNLMRHNINIDGNIVSWNHIRMLYELDKCNPIRLAPKLTDKHLDPGAFLKMRVNLATQVLSHQVATALSLCVTANILPSTVRVTAQFVEKMDILFDLLNSRKLQGDKPARCAITTNGNNITLLKEFQTWIKKWKLCDVQSQSKIASHWGLNVTINSILELCQELLFEGFPFVCTSRFNQDCLESFFGTIRSKGGWNDRPTVRQFRAAYQNALLLLSVETSKSNSNCLAETDFSVALDLNSLFENSQKILTKKDCLFFDNNTKNNVLLNRFPVAILIKQSIEQSHTYFSNLLIKRISLCQHCKVVLCSESIDFTIASKNGMETNKQTNIRNCYPNSSLVSLISNMEVVFIEYIEKWLDMENLAFRLSSKIMEICSFQFLFKYHFEHAFYLQKKIVHIFVISRIFYFIKLYNRELSPRNKKNYKKMERLLHK